MFDEFLFFGAIIATAVLLFIGLPVGLSIVRYHENIMRGNFFNFLIILVKTILTYWYVIFILITLLSIITDNSPDYWVRIDPVDQKYTMFASEHRLSLTVFYALFFAAVILLTAKGRDLPPLALSLCLVFIIIGAVLSGVILVQYHNPKDLYYDDLERKFIVFFHIMNIIVPVGMVINVIRMEREAAEFRIYRSRVLNVLNAFIVKHYVLSVFILLLPVFVIVTVILLLFGQEKDSMVKVWTETATWTFSQREHPPYLNHQGHYLCTVAACGHPCIVKPLRKGVRRGRVITVNRQLMVANAYEEMIGNAFPRFHKTVRAVYDRCGYPISKHITNAYLSDAVYLVMKPLEYFFTISLYLFVSKPEELIGRQYRS